MAETTLISAELRELLQRAAAGIAEWPAEQRAWWIVYFLEALEALSGADEVKPVLEAVKVDIQTRLIAGRW